MIKADMRRVWVILGAWLALAPWAAAEDKLLMARSIQAFPEAMITLQNSIRDHGYTLSRIQRVDIGLTKSGYTTDKYRIVFFGKPEEVERWTSMHPELIPYMPFKMAIFAEQQETLVVAANPTLLGEFFSDDDVRLQFERWSNDFKSILADIRQAE